MKKRLRRPDRYEIDNARRLRLSLTEAERALWCVLRDRSLAGWKFRRQHPLGPLVADFYCAQLRLALELDGSSHDGPHAADERRQAWIESHGIRVLRFSNREVLEQTPDVLARIRRACEEGAG